MRATVQAGPFPTLERKVGSLPGPRSCRRSGPRMARSPRVALAPALALDSGAGLSQLQDAAPSAPPRPRLRDRAVPCPGGIRGSPKSGLHRRAAVARWSDQLGGRAAGRPRPSRLRRRARTGRHRLSPLRRAGLFCEWSEVCAGMRRRDRADPPALAALWRARICARVGSSIARGSPASRSAIEPSSTAPDQMTARSGSGAPVRSAPELGALVGWRRLVSPETMSLSAI